MTTEDFTKELEDFIKELKELNPALDDVYLFIEEHRDKFVKWDDAIFMTCICMMLEEYCKANKLDVVEMAGMIAGSVLDVNAFHGKYGEH